MEHQLASAVGLGIGPGLKGRRCCARLLAELERLHGLRPHRSRLERPADVHVKPGIYLHTIIRAGGERRRWWEAERAKMPHGVG